MEEYIETLMKVHPEDLKPEARKLFDVIMRVIDENDEYKQRINEAKQYAHERLAFLENCFGGNDIEIRACITIHNEYLKILNGDSNE